MTHTIKGNGKKEREKTSQKYFCKLHTGCKTYPHFICSECYNIGIKLWMKQSDESKIDPTFVKEIKNHQENILLICSDGIKDKHFITKKVVLGCGTLITTKLIMDYLKIKKEVKISHHPRLFSLYFSKKKWKSDMQFEPPHTHLKLKNNPFLFTADFRPGN